MDRPVRGRLFSCNPRNAGDPYLFRGRLCFQGRGFEVTVDDPSLGMSQVVNRVRP